MGVMCLWDIGVLFICFVVLFDDVECDDVEKEGDYEECEVECECGECFGVVEFCFVG